MRNGKRTIPVVSGLILIVLLTASIWYFLNVGGQFRNVIPVTRTEASATEMVQTRGSPEEIPDGVTEEGFPGTPLSGFADNFENGLDPVWSVIYGQPLITNGQLTSNIDTGIAAGDASWKNYQIDFDVDASQSDCPFMDSSNSVGVRVNDFDHAYWFVFTGCEAAWSSFAGGVNEAVPNLFPDTTVNISKEKKHFTIKVDLTKMSAYQNGSPLSSIIDSKFHTGGIFLQIEAQTLFDNFKVTLLP